MQNRYLVCYDISDAKRLRRVFVKMKGFGDPVQYSVFQCDLTPMQRVMLESALTEIINLKEDRALIVDLGPSSGRGSERFTTLGKAIASPGTIGSVV
jgi:CRISPR-associated protein Cas2